MQHNIKENIYTSIDVELIGKPIQAIANELKNILTPKLIVCSNKIQLWTKPHSVNMVLKNIVFQQPDGITFAHSASVFQHPKGGLASIHISPDFLMLLSDQFYGARPTVSETANSITMTDMRFQKRIGKQLVDSISLGEDWLDIDTESSPSGATQLCHDIGLIIQIEMRCNDSLGELYFTIDSTLLETLTTELIATPEPITPHDFEAALKKTLLTLDVTLCKKEMPIDQVLALRPDDIIPIDLLINSPVTVKQQHVMNGHVAEKNGQLVLIVNDNKEG